ncbi:hypothetical protein Tco_0909775 [Tanacetum coccineum]|uniref:Uncharacterized protein n=1 Tax=Tanacetum coccineum TaxID=301880 RepID=A0ABQ5CS89_9ASTR
MRSNHYEEKYRGSTFGILLWICQPPRKLSQELTIILVPALGHLFLVVLFHHNHTHAAFCRKSLHATGKYSLQSYPDDQFFGTLTLWRVAHYGESCNVYPEKEKEEGKKKEKKKIFWKMRKRGWGRTLLNQFMGHRDGIIARVAVGTIRTHQDQLMETIVVMPQVVSFRVKSTELLLPSFGFYCGQYSIVFMS